MEKRSFIPFDAETFLMIEDVTGTEPEVTEKENYFELKMYAPDKEERIIEPQYMQFKADTEKDKRRKDD